MTPAMPPGPSRARAAAALARRGGDPFAFLDWCVARYGDVYHLPLGPGGTTVVNRPELVPAWLTDGEHYTKGAMSHALEPVLGDALPIAEGERWRRNRRALNPMFSRRSLDGLAATVSGALADSMARWDRIAGSGEVVDVQRELSILTMQVLQRAMFSSSVDEDELPLLMDRFRSVMLYMGGLMATFWAPGAVPVPYRRRGARAMRDIHALFDRVVAERRAAPTDDADLLNLLLECRHADTEEPLSDADLRDELMGLWVGGYDTTGSALLWTLALLAANPEHAEALRGEADAYHGAFDSIGETRAMSTAKACFDEGQRLQGALLLTRQAGEDATVGDWHVPAGSQVGVSAYTMNRHPDLWDGDPSAYDPTRWLDPERQPTDKYQFVMFGGGPRRCIGSSMAYLEAQFALTMIAQRFHVVPEPGFVPRHQFHLSVGIKGGMPATIRRRRPCG